MAKTQYKDKEFDLFGDKWTIKYVDTLTQKEDNAELYGLTDYGNRTIYIATTLDGKTPVSKRDLRLTLLHELNHAILQSGQYMEETSDEPLIEWMAKCYYKLLEDKII